MYVIAPEESRMRSSEPTHKGLPTKKQKETTQPLAEDPGAVPFTFLLAFFLLLLLLREKSICQICRALFLML